MDYGQSLTYLYSLGHEVLAAKYELESIRVILEELERPDKAYPSVIVAGTNGKGSTAAMIESILNAAGIKAGLYTSPHLVKIEERMRVGGREIEEAEFAFCATVVKETVEKLVADGRLKSTPTFFEQITAIALLYFKRASAELVVLEVGLGGRLDATNVSDPLVAIITSIDLDHQEVLGNDLAQIAAEKAAVIKPGKRTVIARQAYREVTDVLMQRCIDVSVLPVFSNDPLNVRALERGLLVFDYESAYGFLRGMEPGLRGRHQLDNAAAAIETACVLAEAGFEIPSRAIPVGLRSVNWPGRLELKDSKPVLLLDGAHNPAGAKKLRDYMEEFWHEPITLVFAVMSDKDIGGMASELFGLAKTIVLTRMEDRRAASVVQLGRFALGSSRNVVFTEDVSQALSEAKSITPAEGIILVTGSLRLVGEVKRLLGESRTHVDQ